MASIGQQTPCLIVVQDTKLYNGNMSETPVTYVCVCNSVRAAGRVRSATGSEVPQPFIQVARVCTHYSSVLQPQVEVPAPAHPLPPLLCRRLLKVDVDQVYCVKFPEADLPPAPGGRGVSGGRPLPARGAATAVLLWVVRKLLSVSGLSGVNVCMQ